MLLQSTSMNMCLSSEPPWIPSDASHLLRPNTPPLHLQISVDTSPDCPLQPHTSCHWNSLYHLQPITPVSLPLRDLKFSRTIISWGLVSGTSISSNFCTQLFYQSISLNFADTIPIWEGYLWSYLLSLCLSQWTPPKFASVWYSMCNDHHLNNKTLHYPIFCYINPPLNIFLIATLKG